MSDSESVEHWEEHGAKDTEHRAFERWNRMLAEYQPPPLDPGIDEALRDFVARRKAGMEDAWY
jgi:trimethylamine--corrinoid protein Co-methyltransferase